MPQNRFDNQVAEPPSEAKPPQQPPEPQKPLRETHREVPASAPPIPRFSWRPKPIFESLKSTYTEWSRDKAPRMGAALAYYTIFSLAGFYIGKSVTMSAYSVAGSVVIILAWIYYSAQLLYFATEFSHVYSQKCSSQCKLTA